MYARGMTDDEDQPLTLNQVVAANIAFYRQAGGMKQKELAVAIGVSDQAISEVERSATPGNRVREFDAAKLGAYALALGVPVIALFLPPRDDEAARFAVGAGELGAAGLLSALAMPDSDEDGPAMRAYRDRFNDSAARLLTPDWAAVVCRWMRDGATIDARREQAERFRRNAERQRQDAAEWERMAEEMMREDPE
jgi:transcriptional regulator with XRE-family HTH domain